MRKKDWFARVASATALFSATRALSPRARSRLLILAYHRVLPLEMVADDFPFDRELISATSAEFGWQMQFLREHFHPVSLAQIAAARDGGPPLPPRATLVTFDDGYSDNYDFAFPILHRAGVPACFFVSTDIVGTNGLFWFDYVAHVILHAPVGSIALPVSRDLLPLGQDMASRRRAVAQVQGWLKAIPDAERRDFLMQLRRQHGEVDDGRGRQLSRPLNWHQIREMAQAGFEFGSHGATHAVLSRVLPQQLDHEIAGSRARLQLETGVVPSAISYPIGSTNAVNEQVIEKVQASGYRLGLTYIAGANPLHGFEPYSLRRQHVERSSFPSYFEGLVSWPTHW